MSRNRNLAGLAALGALGYMMARGGKKTPAEAAATPVEDRGSMARALIEDDRESQRGEFNPAGLKRNTETGEMYDPSGDVLGRPATRPASPASASRMPSADADFPPVKTPRRNVAGDYTRKMGATAEELAAYRNREITPPRMTPEMRKKAESQALERVTPEEMLVGGPGLKAVNAAAKRLAAPRLAEYTQPLLSGPTARLTGPSRAELTAAERAARDAARRAETARENAARYNTEGPLGGEGFIMRKKGGAVKAKKMASGGSVNSASRRGDGIAQRGKTKGRMR